MIRYATAIALILLCFNAPAQSVPADEENIPFLITFDKNADTSWGDDDFSQTFFFPSPASKQFLYTSGYLIQIVWGSMMSKRENLTHLRGSHFSVGRDASPMTMLEVYPKGNYQSGALLASKTFAKQAEYDNNCYTFGPINPKEGELAPKYGGYILSLLRKE